MASSVPIPSPVPSFCPLGPDGNPTCQPAFGVPFSTTSNPVPAAATPIVFVPVTSNNDGGPQPGLNSALKTTQTSGPSSATKSPTQLQSSSPVRSNGVSKGAVAGVAIAMLLVGAAIAFIVAFFLFKRNRKQDANVGRGEYTKYADSTPELLMVQQKNLGVGGEVNSYFQVAQIPRSTPSPLPIAAHYSVSSDVTSFLPPAASRDEIHRRVSSLFRQIHRHIETYYRDVHASITPSMEPELARFGANSMNMVELLQDCAQPTIVLKHALTAYVLSICGPKSEQDGETLFPEELNGIRTQREGNSISDPIHIEATNLHRRLSVYLYTSALSGSNFRTSWSSQADIREASEHFSLTFFPWANPISSDQEKEEDLTNIVLVALEIRIWLFGQPSQYGFVWEGTRDRNVLVTPGLVQKMNERRSGGDDIIIEATVTGV